MSNDDKNKGCGGCKGHDKDKDQQGHDDGCCGNPGGCQDHENSGSKDGSHSPQKPADAGTKKKG